MNLLIITQKVDADDDVLGFFHRWLLEFGKNVEGLSVICLEKGRVNLPPHVKVFSLGKEEKRSRILYLRRFFQIIWKERHNYDSVFVHMNPEYVVLGGDLWRLLGKKIGLWYVHRNVDLKLRVAGMLAHVIWSTTPEAFRIRSKKVNFVGHGIDLSLFPRKGSTAQAGTFRIVHSGRITPIKNLDVLVEALTILKTEKNKKFEATLAGVPTVPSDFEYEKKLQGLIKDEGLEREVVFAGKIPFSRIGELYREADISVNLTPSGGMDKAVLESLASGTIALSANKAFKELFGEYAPLLIYNERDPEDVAKKIMAIMNMNATQRREIENYLYERVRAHFDLGLLITRIVGDLKKLQ